MTKKNYEALADIISTARLDAVERDSIAALEVVYGQAMTMAIYFAGENKNFDSERFLAACGF